MTSTDLVTPSSVADPAPSRRPTGARRSAPGLSLLAEGEPLVWLTGGALAICVAMILGLLALVGWRGLRTFWPAPLVEVELVDGTRYLGEVARDESYELTAAMAKNRSGARKTAAEQHLGGRPQTTARRRLVRTGNFELTNEHYTEVSDYEIVAEAVPAWAVVAERVEWGRFYGRPRQFVVLHPRKRGEREEALRQLLDFFQRLGGRLPPTETQRLDAALRPWRQQLEELQTQDAQQFVSQFTEGEGKRIECVVGERTVPRTDWRPTDGLSSLREVWVGAEPAWQAYRQYHEQVRSGYGQRRHLQEHEIGRVNHRMEQARLALKQCQIDLGLSGIVEDAAELDELHVRSSVLRLEIESLERAMRSIQQLAGAGSPLALLAESVQRHVLPEIAEQLARVTAVREQLESEMGQLPAAAAEEVRRFLEINGQARETTARLQQEIEQLNSQIERYRLQMATSDGTATTIPLGEIVRAYPANQLALSDKVAVYLSRWYEFVTADPREANSEGGVFPAIWGTIAMTLIMSLVVVPFGVLAALYLREYARAGLLISAVRVAINNLAGVPSIVFGVFGLSFFCYRMGAFLDGGPQHAGVAPWPAPIWFLGLGLLGGISAAAFATSLYRFARPRHGIAPSSRWLSYAAALLWITATAGFVLLLATSPFFHGFYEAQLPNPVFGKGGLLWASLTLALLTLPVVIVATEEALSAVPNSLREGSYACGAGKWQTIHRIVLPHALPGMMTGMILAMARGAGEVAPLMLVGAVKLAPELPVTLADWSGSLGPLPSGPFHLDRSFMHLGFHIYDLGFQSQNVDAAKPLVFTTTLLLIAIVASLNIASITLRAKLRKRFHSGQF